VDVKKWVVYAITENSEQTGLSEFYSNPGIVPVFS